MTDDFNGADKPPRLDLPEAAPPSSAEAQKLSKVANSQRGTPAEANPALLPRNAGKAEFETARDIVQVDPRTIVADPVNVRGDLAFDDSAHADLIASLRALGNTVPVVLRPSPGDEGTYRCVSGSRRIGAALHIQLDRPDFTVRAVILNLTDEEALKIAEADNEGRSVASPIQTGRHWARQIDTLYGGNQTAFAEAVGKDKSVVSRTVALAALPQWILGRCSNVDTLAVDFAAKLAPLLKQESTRLDVKRRADALAASNTQLRGPLLLTALRSDRRADAEDEGIVQEWVGVTGAATARLRRTKTGFAIDINADRIVRVDRPGLLAAIGKFVG